jgi:hypothetical protein
VDEWIPGAAHGIKGLLIGHNIDNIRLVGFIRSAAGRCKNQHEDHAVNRFFGGHRRVFSWLLIHGPDIDRSVNLSILVRTERKQIQICQEKM